MAFERLVRTQPQLAGRLEGELGSGNLPQSVLFYGAPYSSRMTAAVELALSLTGESGRYVRLDSANLIIMPSRDMPIRIAAMRQLCARQRNRKSLDNLVHETGILLSSYHDALYTNSAKDGFEAASELAEVLYGIPQSLEGGELDRFLSDFDKAYAKLSARGRRSQAFTIDQIRAIQSFLQTGGDRDKAVILENIEDVTVGAMNSILKVLEEPPSGAHIILLSRNARRILPTILSRVRQYEFPPVSLERQSALISDLFFSQGSSVEDFIVSAAGLDLAGLEARADELVHQTLVKGRLLDDETLSSLAAFLDEMGSWDLFVTKLAAICEDGLLHGVLEPLRAKRALELLSACQRDATVYAQNRRVMLERIQRGLVAL